MDREDVFMIRTDYFQVLGSILALGGEISVFGEALPPGARGGMVKIAVFSFNARLKRCNMCG